MRFFIFEQAGDACAKTLPRTGNHLVLDALWITQRDQTGANYVRRPLIHDTACGGCGPPDTERNERYEATVTNGPGCKVDESTFRGNYRRLKIRSGFEPVVTIRAWKSRKTNGSCGVLLRLPSPVISRLISPARYASLYTRVLTRATRSTNRERKEKKRDKIESKTEGRPEKFNIYTKSEGR